MAQGTLKSKKLTTATAKSSARKPSVLGPKKGSRTIAPRKQVLVKNAKMTKVGILPIIVRSKMLTMARNTQLASPP